MSKTKYLIAAALLLLVPLLGRIWWVQSDNQQYGYGNYICRGNATITFFDEFNNVIQKDHKKSLLVTVTIKKVNDRQELEILSNHGMLTDVIPFFTKKNGTVFSHRINIFYDQPFNQGKWNYSSYGSYYFDQQYTKLLFDHEIEYHRPKKTFDVKLTEKYEFTGKCEKTS